MPEIAPWENPNLPAPFATIEREIENRPRHFAMWRWDERLVWRDVDYPRLWWATLDVAATLADWEFAIEQARFGRAFSDSYNFSGRGEIVGFDRSVSFALQYYPPHKFYVVVDAQGNGIARWSKSEHWWSFDSNCYKRLQRQRRRRQSKYGFEDPLPIWKSKFQPPNLRNTLLDGFKSIFLSHLSPELTNFLQLGERAEFLGVIKDLVTWRRVFVSLPIDNIRDLIPELSRTYPNLLPIICAHFKLPKNSHFVLKSSIYHQHKTLSCSITVEGTCWSIHSRLSEISTAHELLELQLRLRDALRPILTPVEIEEILTLPARP